MILILAQMKGMKMMEEKKRLHKVKKKEIKEEKEIQTKV